MIRMSSYNIHLLSQDLFAGFVYRCWWRWWRQTLHCEGILINVYLLTWQWLITMLARVILSSISIMEERTRTTKLISKISFTELAFTRMWPILIWTLISDAEMIQIPFLTRYFWHKGRMFVVTGSCYSHKHITIQTWKRSTNFIGMLQERWS